MFIDWGNYARGFSSMNHFLREQQAKSGRGSPNSNPTKLWRWAASRSKHRQWLFLAIAAAFFAITSPYGAVHYLPFSERLAYWFFLVYLGWCIECLLLAINTRYAPNFAKSWKQPCLASLFTAPCIFGCIVTIQQHIIHEPVPNDFLLQLLAAVWLISIILNLGSHYLLQLDQKKAAPNSQKALLMQRLPSQLRTHALLAVKAEDHYVSVITDHGSALVHMKFSDALLMLGDYPGLKVHRSWWVAADAVESMQRKDGRPVLALTSGQNVPVSRNGSRLIREQGWFVSS